MCEEEVEQGIATVTGPTLVIVDGFTSDRVVDVNTSDYEDREGSPLPRIPVSSTSDEGVQSQESWEAYLDDEILVIEGQRVESGHSSDTSSGLTNDHGRPSIAGALGEEVEFDDDESLVSGVKLDQDTVSHGGPSIAGTLGEELEYDDDETVVSGVKLDHDTVSDGGPSIAGTPREQGAQCAVVDGIESRVNDDGSLVCGVDAAGGNMYGLRDESCEGNMGGGPQVSNWHPRSSSMTGNDNSTMDDNEKVSDEGHGVIDEGAGDGQAKCLKGMSS